MSLFRSQALEQRRLPESLFTSVTIVTVQRWMWLGIAMTVLGMLSVWMVFGRLYTTYEMPLILEGTRAYVALPTAITDALSDTSRAVLRCPHKIETHLVAQNGVYSVPLDQPVYATCEMTLIVRIESPLERLLR